MFLNTLTKMSSVGRYQHPASAHVVHAPLMDPIWRLVEYLVLVRFGMPWQHLLELHGLPFHQLLITQSWQLTIAHSPDISSFRIFDTRRHVPMDRIYNEVRILP